MVVWGLGFWGWGFPLMGFKACGVEPSGFFWYGALYINMKNKPGKKMVRDYYGTSRLLNCFISSIFSDFYDI